MSLTHSTPVKVVLDTDMSGDCDDVGALAVLHQLANAGEAEILACVVDGHDEDKAVAAAVDATNTYYGRPQIPVGTYQGPKHTATKSAYTSALRDEFPHAARPDDQMPKALDVYRKALANVSDHSVTIISIGFLVNLAELLQSSADQFSPLSGIELVRTKVKELVVMGGHFPKGDGAEYNFGHSDGGPFTRYAIENWPTPILFSGWELGESIITGKTLKDAPPSPLRRAYELYTKFAGRQSWDLVTVLAAVRDPNLYWTIQSNGYCHVNPDGTNEWTPTPNRGHSYLVAKAPPADVGKILDDLLLLPPKK
jgi:hypothetical protein